MSNFSLWGCPHGQCVPGAAVIVTRSLGSVTFLLFKFQFIKLLHRTTKHVILGGARSAESKNPRIFDAF